MKADLKDLELEQWLRAREKGEIKWVTKDGREIPINEMTDTHLENAINYIVEREEMIFNGPDIDWPDSD